MAKRKTLTLQDVKDQIKAIKEKAKTDFESAYSWEIDLYKDVLETIKWGTSPYAAAKAKGRSISDSEMAELAAEALKASKIKFRRVTA